MKHTWLGFVLVAALLVGCGDVNDDNNNTDQSPTPTGNESPTPTPGQVPVAQADNDSLQSPAESHFMSPTGVRDFTYEDEISHPTGDAEDFIEFEFPNDSNTDQNITITLDCAFTGQQDPVVRVDIYEDGVQGNETVFCNDGPTAVTVNNTMVQTAVVNVSVADQDVYVGYSLFVDGNF